MTNSFLQTEFLLPRWTSRASADEGQHFCFEVGKVCGVIWRQISQSCSPRAEKELPAGKRTEVLCAEVRGCVQTGSTGRVFNVAADCHHQRAAQLYLSCDVGCKLHQGVGWLPLHSLLHVSVHPSCIFSRLTHYLVAKYEVEKPHNETLPVPKATI